MAGKDIDLRDRIILALDVENPEIAKELVKRTESHLGFYKVGLQLFFAGGFDIVDWIVDRGHQVMLDLKLHDISATVALAVEQLAGHGVFFATVHGEPSVVKAAAAAAGDTVRILAVTVLTSLGEEDLKDVGITKSLPELVQFRARAALAAGCAGVVASGHEAAMLRENFGRDFFIVTPGIRPGANIMDGSDDQTRIMTAGRALANGADHVVVGRPISKAADPIAVIEEIQTDIEKSLG